MNFDGMDQSAVVCDAHYHQQLQGGNLQGLIRGAPPMYYCNDSEQLRENLNEIIQILSMPGVGVKIN